MRQQGIVEGGSTITQQFVKNAYIRNEQTLARKVREAALAWQLEQRWSKDRILTAYLNTIYFGHGAYGIQQAARAYFKKSAKDLTLADSALLAGIPSDPSLYDPASNPRSATLRRRHVLRLMFDQGKISRSQFRRADRAPLPVLDDIRLPGTQGPAPYFVNYVKDDLVARYGAGRVFGGGLKVTTTIDLDLQLKARAAIESVLRNPDGPAAALVAIDPRDGAVKAMFGGRNFRQSQFNLAAQAKRQPGSSFKPIVLATAMNEGISPVTELESKPVSIDAGDRIWKVTNYDHTYLGRVSLSRAIVSSDNSVFAQLTDLVGPKAIVKTARSLGIRSRLVPYFSIGLGSGAVSPLDMARAYATIANDGRRIDGSEFGNRPRVVQTVERFRSSRVDANVPSPKQVMDEGHAELLTQILQDVVRVGTGKRAAIRRTPDRRQDGNDGQLRRRVVRRVHAGARRRRVGRVPRRAQADAHRVQRRAGGRWNAPRGDLEGVRREDRGRTTRGRSTPRPISAVHRRGWCGATDRGSSTTATAADLGSSPTSPGRGRTRRQTASRTRSRCRSSSG